MEEKDKEKVVEGSAVEAPEEGAGSSQTMTDEEKFNLVRSVGEECVQDDELRSLLLRKPHPVCYDGFEPSGRMHLAQGVMKALNVNKLTSSGCKFIFWVADWFAMLNNKMGGDLRKIKLVGEYMIEVWKAVGMEMENVEFLWSSEHINQKPDEYWSVVMDIARRNTVSRIKRCVSIMGRSEEDELSAGQILYPCMQCADIFFLKADICQLGVDQRKVNMLAREYAGERKMKFKPVILAHTMLPGLKQGQEKMSKSDPQSAIFMEDSEGDVNSKIKRAFCPVGEVDGNPIIQYVKHVVLPWAGQLDVKRSESNGGDISYTDFSVLEEDYRTEKLHPGDLKPAVARAINVILQPVRDHFKKDSKAGALLKRVRSLKVTR